MVLVAAVVVKLVVVAVVVVVMVDVVVVDVFVFVVIVVVFVVFVVVVVVVAFVVGLIDEAVCVVVGKHKDGEEGQNDGTGVVDIGCSHTKLYNLSHVTICHSPPLKFLPPKVPSSANIWPQF